MRFIVILIFFFFGLTSQLQAQTKLIAHKSHSGSSATFKAALRNNDADLKNSNFGRAPERTIRTAQLDSVIYVSPAVAIMVTSKYCQDFGEDDKRIWKAGRDTVYNHPLFSRQHELDAIKATLNEEYHFQNPIEKVKFIGYDNKKSKAVKKNEGFLFPFQLPNQMPPFYKMALTLIASIGFCFLAVSLLLRNRLQLKPQGNR